MYIRKHKLVELKRPDPAEFDRIHLFQLFNCNSCYFQLF